MPNTGIELATLRSLAPRSNQLNHSAADCRLSKLQDMVKLGALPQVIFINFKTRNTISLINIEDKNFNF